MKKVKSLFILPMLLMLSFCSDSMIPIDVNVTWNDESFYDETGDWYVGIWADAALMASQLDGDAFYYEAVTPGTDTTVSTEDDGGSAQNYAAAVFRDANGNGKYDEGEDITGMASDVGEGGSTLTLEVTPYY